MKNSAKGGKRKVQAGDLPRLEKRAGGKASPQAKAVVRSSAAKPRKAAKDGLGRSPAPADDSKPDFGDGQPSSNFPIVGIGASAGGLEAFSELLSHLPEDTGMGFVLVQHLAPGHESILPELLARTTALPVQQAKNEQRVEPNHIYVIPENTSMTITGGALQLRPREKMGGKLRSVDVFLQSLAKDRTTCAIGVILSGTDFDGTAGLEAVKTEGGITFAQDEKTARFDSMPRNAATAGFADFVLPPARIAEELGRLAISLGAAPGTQPPAPVDETGFKEILQILRARKGVDLSLYKPNTIQRRIKRRMVMHQGDRAGSYLKYLRSHPEEIEALYQDVLIGVTSFFRDPDVFEALKEKVFPKIISNRTPDEPVRIWVAGCSTGQEVYSLAMAFLEYAGKARTQIPLQIFGTDLNEVTLEKARAGRYTRSQVQEVSAERVRRFFVEQDGTLQICKPIREMCIFARHDIGQDPPFSRMDLVSCRNLMIYFEPPLQKKVLSVLHYALKPGGYALLGSSETVGDNSNLFAPEHKKERIYCKKYAPGRPRISLPISPVAEREAKQGARGASGTMLSLEADAQREADRLVLTKYAPSGVVVNHDFEVLHFRGTTGRYLEPMPGKASLNVLRMAREGLLMPLRTALHQVKKRNQPVRKEGVVVRFNGDSETINLLALPLQNLRERCFLVLFEPASAKSAEERRVGREKEGRRRAGTREESAAEIERLQDENAALKDYIQMATEQHDAANEELQASNEEAQSANEELQSINEELETTKEELQSTNEELQTVNEEMNNRNVELHRLNNDLSNVLSGVQMCIVVVGNDLCIRRFTPLAERVLNLVPTDAGRPISHIKPNIQFPDLESFISETIEEGRTRETEVQDKEGHWYSLRALPYRTFDNRTDGGVLLLVDIDAVKRSEERIRAALDYAEGIIETVREPMLVLDSELRVQSGNRSYFNFFRVSPEETLHRFVFELGDGAWNRPKLRELLGDVLPRNSFFDDFEVTHDFERIGSRTVLLNARPIADSARRPERILLAIEDITDRKAVELIRDSENRYRTLAETLPQLVWTCGLDGECDYFNARYSEYTGVPLENLLGDGWRECISPIDREQTCAYWMEALKGNVPYDLDYRIQGADGIFRWFKTRAVPLRDKTGKVIKWFGTSTDIDEEKRAHLMVEESERWLRIIMESIQDFAVFTLDSKGKISSWHPGAEQVFGYRGEEAMGQPGAIVFTPEDRAAGAPEEEIRTAMTNGCALDERWHQGKNGRRIFLSGALRVLRGEKGEPRGFIKVARDITERKEQEEELRRARDELEEKVRERTARLSETVQELESFSYSVSHDMRAPLRSMLSFAQIVRDECREELGAKGKEYLERIVAGARRLDQLVQDILIYSRTGRAEFKLEKVDLERLIADAITDNLEVQFQTAELEVQKPLLPVKAHEAALMQCVVNLLANAVKFVPPGVTPRIQIWSEAAERGVRLCIRDNGIGINREDQKRIFILFEQINPPGRYEGTGVGLAIVRKTIERMGGSVGVISEPQKGSTFWVELEAAMEEA